MLVVVAIIGIIATTLLGALFWATEKARKSRTESLIRKIDGQLGFLFEAYETRRTPLTVPAIDPSTGNPPTPDAIAAAQLIFLREIMRMELPDLYEDLQLDRVDAALVEYSFPFPALPGGCTRPASYVPSITRAYQQRVKSAAQLLVTSGKYPDAYAALDAMKEQNQSAEMLYLVMTMNLDEDYGPRFGEKDTGDTDGDGMPELVDGWKRPIEWLRWPAGFSNLNSVGGPTDWGYVSDRNRIEAFNFPDPFNPRRIDLPPTTDPIPASSPPVPSYGFLMHPLVVSAGPDGEYGIVFRRSIPDTSTAAEKEKLREQYSDPYYFWQESATSLYKRRGTPTKFDITEGKFDELDTPDDGDPIGEWVHLDNLTNHLTDE
jgi:hypothetical protein